MQPRRTRYRPPGTVLTNPTEIANLPLHTALQLDDRGHRDRIRGRLTATTGREITLATCTDQAERTIAVSRIASARVIPSPLRDGELVHKRGVPDATWRGGIIRLGQHPDTGAPAAYVQGTDGFEWIEEHRLISAEHGPRSLAPARPVGRPRRRLDARLAAEQERQAS